MFYALLCFSSPARFVAFIFSWELYSPSSSLRRSFSFWISTHSVRSHPIFVVHRVFGAFCSLLFADSIKYEQFFPAWNPVAVTKYKLWVLVRRCRFELNCMNYIYENQFQAKFMILKIFSVFIYSCNSYFMKIFALCRVKSQVSLCGNWNSLMRNVRFYCLAFVFCVCVFWFGFRCFDSMLVLSHRRTDVLAFRLWRMS